MFFCCQSHSLVTIPTALSRFLVCSVVKLFVCVCLLCLPVHNASAFVKHFCKLTKLNYYCTQGEKQTITTLCAKACHYSARCLLDSWSRATALIARKRTEPCDRSDSSEKNLFFEMAGEARELYRSGLSLAGINIFSFACHFGNHCIW